jgi:uncharacterized membrane protein
MNLFLSNSNYGRSMLSLSVLLALSSAALFGQCVNPPVLSKTAAWASFATKTNIGVNISPAFSTAQQQSIVSAFTAWAGSTAVKDADLGFTFTYSSTPNYGDFDVSG